MFFIKSLTGGIAAAIVAWAIVVALEIWRIVRVAQTMGPGPLRAVAFEWGYILLKPWVISFLTISFGLGLWLTSHYLARRQASP
jgi:hypothetical protein